MTSINKYIAIALLVALVVAAAEGKTVQEKVVSQYPVFLQGLKFHTRAY